MPIEWTTNGVDLSYLESEKFFLKGQEEKVQHAKTKQFFSLFKRKKIIKT